MAGKQILENISKGHPASKGHPTRFRVGQKQYTLSNDEMLSYLAASCILQSDYSRLCMCPIGCSRWESDEHVCVCASTLRQTMEALKTTLLNGNESKACTHGATITALPENGRD